MPLEDGKMFAQFYGNTAHAQTIDKITQMRRDLEHIQQALSALERRVKSKTPADQMTFEFTVLYNWSVSLMESLFAMTWATFDKAKTEKVIKDFDNKFKSFTTSRTMVLSGRQPAGRH